ncbi:MAG: hypothetical protein M3464_02035 [Chloroflexota bacterium]|nr:hypothetical protein [Chloroflexota bacterium]
MALYLVIHTPNAADDNVVRRPTRLVDLARASTVAGVRPRWIKTWTPDVHDDRIFSLWEAANAAEIVEALAYFGYLDEMTVQALNVREWGPAEVLAAADEGA